MQIRVDLTSEGRPPALIPKSQTVFSINGREPKDYNFVMKSSYIFGARDNELKLVISEDSKNQRQSQAFWSLFLKIRPTRVFMDLQR